MKSIYIFFVLIIITSFGCQKEFNEVFVADLETRPSGGVTAVKVSDSSLKVKELTVDFFILDHFGQFIKQLDISQVSIDSLSPFLIEEIELNKNNPNTAEEYSAMLLFDDSGSISFTDFDDKRLEAGNSLVDLIVGNEELAISRFSGSISGNVELITDFTTDKELLRFGLSESNYDKFGGTPVYASSFTMLGYTDAFKSNENGALVCFTDGLSDGDTKTANQVISQSNLFGIPVYNIGLGTENDIEITELSRIAYSTGGAFMQAEETSQLFSLYSSLSDLMRGSAETYKMKVDVRRDFGNWKNGDIVYFIITFSTGEKIRLPVVAFF